MLYCLESRIAWIVQRFSAPWCQRGSSTSQRRVSFNGFTRDGLFAAGDPHRFRVGEVVIGGGSRLSSSP